MNEQQSEDLYRFDHSGALLETKLPLPRRSGKVRDVYDLGTSLLIISTDRISAFDYILPCGIPGKGQLLTQMSSFWFEQLGMRHHLVSTEIPPSLATRFDIGPLKGRVMLTEKAEVIPFECVVRGYLEGSGLKEYQATGEICGNPLPTDLGETLAHQLRDTSLQIYSAACEYAAARGLLIADTKFEFGKVGDEVVLIDEVLTPDSSRFWAADNYCPGQAQASFDKQFVREWLSQCGWDKQSDPPALPAEVIEQTAAKYREAYDRLTA